MPSADGIESYGNSPHNSHDRDRSSPKRRRTSNGYSESPPSRHSPDTSSPGLESYRQHLPERLASREPRRAYDEQIDDSDGDESEPSRNREREMERAHLDTPDRKSSTPDVHPVLPEKPKHLHYKPKLILKGHKKGVSAVKYSPDGRQIASCSADGTIKVWDAVTGKHEHTFEGHLAGISTIAWSPDSKLIASGSDDKSIRLWDVTSGKQHPVPFLGHHNYIYSIAFSPKGNMLVSGSYDEAVFLWDVRSARVLRSLPAHSDPVSGVDFVRDGTLIVSCAGDGLIRVWDTATGQCLRTLVHEDNAAVVSVRFSPNGKFVLAWTLDSCVRLWNYVEGRCVKTYQAHRNVRYSIGGAFGVYGDRRIAVAAGQPVPGQYAFVASGSEDGSILLWDVSSKEVLQRLRGHADVVLGVDTHPTEAAIVSAGLDRTVRIWRCDDGEVGNGAEVEDRTYQESGHS